MSLDKKTSPQNTSGCSATILSSLTSQLGRLFIDAELRLLSNAMSEADRTSIDLTINRVVEMAVGRLHGDYAGVDQVTAPDVGSAARTQARGSSLEKYPGRHLARKETDTFLYVAGGDTYPAR